MKTAISLPDSVFRKAERFAQRLKKTRSKLYVDAIVEYLERHAPDTMTEAMNQVCEKVGGKESDFSSRAARKVLTKESW